MQLEPHPSQFLSLREMGPRVNLRSSSTQDELEAGRNPSVRGTWAGLYSTCGTREVFWGVVGGHPAGAWILLHCFKRNRGAKRARPRPKVTLLQPMFGEWLSLVEHLVRDQGVGGSNPLSPTILGFWPY